MQYKLMAAITITNRFVVTKTGIPAHHKAVRKKKLGKKATMCTISLNIVWLVTNVNKLFMVSLPIW